MGKLLVGIGTWLLADSIVSLYMYIGREEEGWIRNHSIRIVRGILAVAVIVIGVVL